MRWVNWSDKQVTGHLGMDRDHEQLVELINQLAEAMENNRPKAVCSQTLERFIELIRLHFLAEEQQMDRHRYPQAKEHKALHAMLLQDVLAFKTSYDTSDAVEYVTLLVILDNWLKRDILTADKSLADFMAAIERPPASLAPVKAQRS